LLTRLLLEAVNAFAKSCHGNNPQNVNTGYGTPSDGIPASRPKKTLKTIIMNSG
jgi:hypothetical protein